MVYRQRMKFTLQMFWANATKGDIEPFLPPLSLEFPSTDDARRVFTQILGHPKIPVHSLTLVSEDGTTSERWFQIDGEWRRKDV
jgi:hypothetical protein